MMFTRGYPLPEESSLAGRTTGEHAGFSSARQAVDARFGHEITLLVI
jgi:hypothetical protein